MDPVPINTFNSIDQYVTDVEKDAKEQEEKKQKQVADRIAKAEAPKDPSEYNLGDNVKELGNAVIGGGVDIYNSVASLPKLLDKRFYQKSDPSNPWKYDAPWLIKNKPITHTKWGNFIRGGIELTGGMVGTGKVMWGVKGLKGLATAARATRLGRVGLGAAQGATYDLISNQSQESNLVRNLIDIKPEWSGNLEFLATNETMSPATRSMYNIAEGLGIGAFLDLTFEAAGWGIRANSIEAKKRARKIVKPDPLTKSLEDSSQFDYDMKGKVVEEGARKAYERSAFRKYKTKLTKEAAKNNLPAENVTIAQWRKSNKAWESLSNEQRKGFMDIYADKNDIDWGEVRDMTARDKRQKNAGLGLAYEQLELDMAKRKPRINPAYGKGGGFTDNQSLSIDSNPVEGVRDMIEIKGNFSQKYGAPRGQVSEAQQRKLNYANPGTVLSEVDRIEKALVARPSYIDLISKGGKSVKKEIARSWNEIQSFLSESGNNRLLSDVPEEDLLKKIGEPKEKLVFDGEVLPVLSSSQVHTIDLMLGQFLYEARDLAKAALSVSGEISATSPGSFLDGIMARYTNIARLRKETSLAFSTRFKNFGTGSLSKEDIMTRASDSVANEVAEFKKLLQGDIDNDMLETFLHFTATSNGSKQSALDMHTFFSRKLKGYKNQDQFQRGAIVNEAMTMGFNSILSGPKTPVRALFGTGLGTAMRPVATMIGAVGDTNGQVFRGAMASVSGMIDSTRESWQKAAADWNSYLSSEEGFRGYTVNTKDAEFNSMMSYFDQYGTVGEKAMAQVAGSLRYVNKLPFLNYGPRVMKSMDVFFTQMIGRGRQRQIAFDHVYNLRRNEGQPVENIGEMVKAVEKDFEGRVFSADGQVTDEMAKYAADEAKLTKELTGFAKDLDQAFDRMPFLRPFFLFARTGVNALEMTSKYTPGLNLVIKEHADIMSKNFDDPELLRYGIKTAEDLEIARATMRGRWAIGYGVTSTATMMALNGNLTGNGPPDRQLRDAWQQSGKWQPRSIKIGDSYVSYESLEPFNMFLSFAADVVDAQKVMGNDWAGNEFGKLAYMMSANVTNKSFLSGLLQLQDLLTSQGGDASRVAANFVNNQFPLGGLRNEIGKVLSPGMRELESGFWQSIGNRNLWADVGGGTKNLPYRYDILNGEVLRDWEPMTRFINALLPFNLNIGASNETREWLMRSGLNLKQTFNTGTGGVSLDGRPDLKSKFNFYLGQQGIEQQLADVLEDPVIRASIIELERHPEKDFEAKYTEHGQVIMPIFREAKRKAWELLLEDPELGRDAKVLTESHRLGRLQNEYRQQGDSQFVSDIDKQIEQMLSIPR